MSRLLVLGATGLVGSRVMAIALNDARVTQIVAPTRRPLDAHPKLVNPAVDLDRGLPEAEWWAVDGVICTIGTTRRIAGSDEAFRRVDFDIPLSVAGKTREAGASCFALTSSIGANARSRLLYPRTKGELEESLRGLGFASLTILRPNVLGGRREEFRLGERAALAVLGAAAFLLPRRYRISPAEVVASVLLEAAIAAPWGTHVIEADKLCG